MNNNLTIDCCGGCLLAWFSPETPEYRVPEAALRGTPAVALGTDRPNTVSAGGAVFV
jgi:hypothetical protein